MVYIIQGNFYQAYTCLSNLKLNINPDVYKVANEDQLALYFTATLLSCFDREKIKLLKANTNSLMYKIMDDNLQLAQTVDSFLKCKYFELTKDFINVYLPQFEDDAFLKSHCYKIQNDYFEKATEEVE